MFQMRRRRVSCGGWSANICQKNSGNFDFQLMNRSKPAKKSSVRDSSQLTARKAPRRRERPRKSKFHWTINSPGVDGARGYLFIGVIFWEETWAEERFYSREQGLKVRTFIYHRLQGNQNSSGLQCEVVYW